MPIVVLGCIFEALLLRISRPGDLRERVVETIFLLLLAGIVYLVLCYWTLRTPHVTRSPRLLWWGLAAALVFRLTVWRVMPSLTDDPFRYRWEGQLQAAGGNPYQVRPRDAAYANLRDRTFSRVTGKDFKAVYGPLTERLELWTYAVVSRLVPDPVRQVFWFKLPYAIFDLGVIAALRAWLAARGLPPERVLIYAWSPLPIMEFWASGHNDSLALLLVALAFVAAARKRWTLAFAGLALATAAKIWPAFLIPLFIGWNGRRPLRWYQWWVVLPIMAALAWPYRSNVIENIRFMSGFAGGWRNNDSVFGLLLWFTKDLYAAKKVVFGIMVATVGAVLLLRLPLERAALWVITITLMVSSNCHPWYLTWIVPLLAFLPVPALLLWTVLAPLAYQAVIAWFAMGVWQGSTAIRWYEYVPVYGLLGGAWLVRLISSHKYGTVGT
jgi:alpha-1,6-mannosyltransferase